jgi:uncharacterized protein YegJ (DUF2314 family)
MARLTGNSLLLLSCLVLQLVALSSQTSQSSGDKLSPLAKNAPKDKPVSSANDRTKAFENAIAPYVAKARATLPDTKKRFLKGLNKGEVLFVTIRLYGPDNKFEQVFVEVKTWKDQTITGVLSTEPTLVKGHQSGERIVIDQKDVYDWTVSKPDGTEEGNFVGNFLDNYRP